MAEYKPLIFFLSKFFIVYFVLTLGYDFYLKDTQIVISGDSKSDPYTKEVAEESSKLYNIFFGGSTVSQNKDFPFMNFYIGDEQAAIINQGCNAISVMIIMIAFIVAFGVKFIPTFLYTLISVFFVHLVNIFRISILANVIVFYNEYAKIAHDVLFPGVIYGAVIIICIIWIKFFIFKGNE